MRLSYAATKTVGIVVLLALAAFVPMIQAGQCSVSSYHGKTAVCETRPAYSQPTVSHSDVFVSPFEPLDVFVFVGTPTVAVQAQAAAPPAQQQLPAGFPHAQAYVGQNAAPPAGGPDLKAVAQALSSCTACHTAPSGKRGVNIFAASGAFDPKVSRKAIYDSVVDDSMPKRGSPLTAAQKKLLAEWVAAGQQKGP